MSAHKHTPGPWWIDESAISVTVRGANGEAVFHESDKRLQWVMADARLIAAAPDLLDALEDLVSLCEAVLPRTEHDTDAELFDARSAISKATGGAE